MTTGPDDASSRETLGFGALELRVALQEPVAINFSDLMFQWAKAVLEAFSWFAFRDHENLAANVRIVECWVGADFCLYARCRHREHLVGHRLGRVDVDPTSAGLISPSLRHGSSATSVQQASNYYHGVLDAGLPIDGSEWEDQLGYKWYGPPPDSNWEASVNGARLLSVAFDPLD